MSEGVFYEVDDTTLAIPDRLGPLRGDQDWEIDEEDAYVTERLQTNSGATRVFRSREGAEKAILDILIKYKEQHPQARAENIQDGWVIENHMQCYFRFFKIVPSKFQIEE